MRNAMVQLCIVLIGISSIHAVKLLQTSSLHFRLSPSSAAEKVWAIQGKDSVEMLNVNGEYYLRSITPGHWDVSVEAMPPYQSIRFTVTGMRPAIDQDLGEIGLKK